MKNQKKIKEKVEKELSKYLEAGLSEQQAIWKTKQNLLPSYSVKLIHRFKETNTSHATHKDTPFFKRLKEAQVDGSPRVNGRRMRLQEELMKL